MQKKKSLKDAIKFDNNTYIDFLAI